MILGTRGQHKTAWTHVLIILATVAVTYLPVVAFDYGYADDYWVLFMRPLNHEVISVNAEDNNEEGRPLLSIWQLGVFGLCDGIQDLRFVRLLSVIGIFLAALVFYNLVRRHLAEQPIDAALMAAIFSVNPCFLVVGGWAENGFISYGCLFGLLASDILLGESRPLANTDAPSSADRPWSRPVLCALFLFAAVFLYQPTGMVFWLGIAIWIIGRFSATREDWIKLIKMSALFFAIIFAYFLFCHAVWPPSHRFHLSYSFFRRMGWFVVFPLKSALSYPFIQPSVVWSIIALYILSFGIWSFCQRTSRTLWIPLLILIMTPLTVIPTIVSYIHYDVSRTRCALYGVIIILWCVTLDALVRRYGSNLIKLRHILFPATLALAICGQYDLQRYLIMPQLWEESALLISLQEYVHENPNLDRPIAIFPPPVDITEVQGGDEMGFASLTRPEAPLYEIPIFLAKVTGRKVEDIPRLDITTLYTRVAPPPGAFVIDFDQLRNP